MSLAYLDLNSNILSGNLPTEIGLLTNLSEYMYFVTGISSVFYISNYVSSLFGPQFQSFDLAYTFRNRIADKIE
jgi:hypothetical protein